MDFKQEWRTPAHLFYSPCREFWSLTCSKMWRTPAHLFSVKNFGSSPLQRCCLSVNQKFTNKNKEVFRNHQLRIPKNQTKILGGMLKCCASKVPKNTNQNSKKSKLNTWRNVGIDPLKCCPSKVVQTTNQNSKKSKGKYMKECRNVVHQKFQNSENQN